MAKAIKIELAIASRRMGRRRRQVVRRIPISITLSKLSKPKISLSQSRLDARSQSPRESTLRE